LREAKVQRYEGANRVYKAERETASKVGLVLKMVEAIMRTPIGGAMKAVMARKAK
jgi:hypothetical protein